MQHALATLTDIAASEQILIVNGTPLDARQPLSAYRLPNAPARACPRPDRAAPLAPSAQAQGAGAALPHPAFSRLLAQA